MESLAQVAPVVTPLLSPYAVGQLDAQEGKLAIPELYFVHHLDKCEYAEGYSSIAGHTLTTRQFLSDADIDAELAEYQDWREDAEWHSRGAW
jgi:hypothetical protein